MKHNSNLFLIPLVIACIILSTYKSYSSSSSFYQEKRNIITKSADYYKKREGVIPPNIDFSLAAEKAVQMVVHVKNIGLIASQDNMQDNIHDNRQDNSQNSVEKEKEGPKTEPKGMASGVVISDDGYIVTNNHVVNEATEIEVTLNNNKTFNAKIIGNDPIMDIALLKIDADEKLPYAIFANSDLIKLGEWVLTAGDPFNLNSTVTAGIISAKVRSVENSSGVSYIQTDAAVNPGGSGGPLVNARGELIGIANMIWSPTGSYSGYSFAIPSNITQKIVNDIIEFGSVQKVSIGIEGRSLDSSYSKELGIPQTQGYYIENVTENSGAETAGIQKGDIIVKIDHQNIYGDAELMGYIYSKQPKDKVQINLLREGKNKTISVVLSQKIPLSTEFKGLELENINTEDKKKFSLDEGIKIKSISNKNLKPYQDELVGNVILNIDNEKISNLKMAEKLFNKKNPNDGIRIEIINQKGEISKLYI
jgi:serine protease Do